MFQITGVDFCPILGQDKDELRMMTIRTLFDENISKQFYIRLCVKIFNELFCLLFKLLLKYILINTFKNFLLGTLTYMRMKLPMLVVLNSQTADGEC